MLLEKLLVLFLSVLLVGLKDLLFIFKPLKPHLHGQAIELEKLISDFAETLNVALLTIYQNGLSIELYC